MAGREMTAGLPVSASYRQPGRPELMGWAAASYQSASWPRTGTGSAPSPPCCFSPCDDAVLLHSKTHSVPGYLKLRFGESSRTLSAVSFAFMTVLHERHQHVFDGLVMKVVLGWDINFSIWILR